MSTTPSASQSRITTAEELDALDLGTVVASAVGTITARVSRETGALFGSEYRVGWLSLTLPAEVVWPVPAAPPVSDTSAATITRKQRAILARTLATRFGMHHADPEDLGWFEQADAVLAALGLTVTTRDGAERMTDATEPTVRYWRQDATGCVDTMRAADVNEELISSDWTEVHVLSDAELAAIKAEVAESIARRIEAVDPIEWALAGQHAGTDAARIARTYTESED